ncbi:50S ribosomal protein L17 [Verrucomicrobiota bacterium]
MRHRSVSSTFGRSSSHRQAMLAALVCSLINEKRIKTTLPRAKFARRLADKMVTLAKDGTVVARRRAISILHQRGAVNILFSDIAPQCQDRQGGYVRIIRVGERRGDNSKMAILEWVSVSPVDKKKKRVPKEEAAKGGETS